MVVRDRERWQEKQSDVAKSANRRGLLPALAFGRFVGPYLKYNESQPRDEQGRWTETGADDDSQTTGSITPIENDARTGNLKIDSVTDKLLERLAIVLDAVGPGSGPIHGIRVHMAFAEAIRASGIPNVETEGTWFDGRSLPIYGVTGSIRTDVVLMGYDDLSPVKAVWVLKTGGAVLTAARAARIRSQVGVDLSVPVIQLSDRRGVRLKSSDGVEVVAYGEV